MNRRSLVMPLLLAVGLVGWAILAWVVAPGILEAAYRGESLPVLNKALAGRAVHPLEHYLGYWAALRVRVLLGLLAVSAVWVLHVSFGRAIARPVAKLAARVAGANPLHVPLGWVFLYALSFGMAAGLLEYAGARAWSAAMDRPPWPYSPFAPWLTPVGSALALVFLVAVLSPALARWRSLRSVPVLVFALTLASVHAVLRIALPNVHPLAAAALAAGLAVQLARTAAARAVSADRLIRRAAPVLAGVVALVFLGQFGGRALRERLALADMADAAGDSPNVLILLLDTVRAHNLGLYGYEREPAPGLRRLAATGMVFDRAIATSSWSLPSHASLFTGRMHPELTGDLAETLDPAVPTLAEVLRVRGYRTGAFFANLLFGNDYFGLNRGFVHHETKFVSLPVLFEDSWMLRTLRAQGSRFLDLGALRVHVSADALNERILRWLQRDSGRPFFAFANYFDAHDPYLPPAPFDTLFWPVRPRGQIESASGTLTEAERKELIAAYDGAIAYIDHKVSQLLGELDRRGQLRNTLVIVLSDHGEEFGSRGTTGHGNSLYMASIHVPLILSFPGRMPGGQRVSEAVSLGDIPSTVLDLLGIAEPAGIEGASLTRHWRSPAEPSATDEGAVVSEVSPQTRHPEAIPESSPTHYGQVLSIVWDDNHYILRGDGHEEIYDLARDPDERVNLTDSPASAGALQQARRLLDSVRRSRLPTRSGS